MTKTKTITLKVTETTYNKIEKLSKKKKTTKSEVIRSMIDDMLEIIKITHNNK